MEVNKEELRVALEATAPGLASRELVQQSDCYVFKNGRVTTFNDELCCSYPIDIGCEGVIKAPTLLKTFKLLPDEVVTVEKKGNEIIFSSKKKKVGFTIETQIELPLNVIKPGKKWSRLPKTFCTALSMVKDCAAKNETKFSLACIHLTPHYIEACDRYQLARYMIELPITDPILAHRIPLGYASSVNVRKIAVAKGWVHFKNRKGLILSIRTQKEDYKDLDRYLKVMGKKIKMPEKLRGAIDLGAVFAAETSDNQVEVTLTSNRLHIKGKGETGWMSDEKQIKYEGPELHFMIPPVLFAQLLVRGSTCTVSKSVLRLTSGECTFIVSLGVPKTE